jgi:hypothetical protein
VPVALNLLPLQAVREVDTDFAAGGSVVGDAVDEFNGMRVSGNIRTLLLGTKV